MTTPNERWLKRIGIIGGGPAALLMLKHLVASGQTNFTVDIFEAGERTGIGFPYSNRGAAPEHITNVSGNEIPELETSTTEWLKTVPAQTLEAYGINLQDFNEYHVFPRLLFGQYLHAQFELIMAKAASLGIVVKVHLNHTVTDIQDRPTEECTDIIAGEKIFRSFSQVIVCSGHQWPRSKETVEKGWYDSPYPPGKISRSFNHAIAIKGSSLTAIDAVRTLAKTNGRFYKNTAGRMAFEVSKSSPDFTLVLYSLQGLLPAVRFHLEDSHLSGKDLISETAIACHREENNGFVSLDFIFEQDFKMQLRAKDPALYQHIKDLPLEAFVDHMMNIRENADPFQLMKAEYEEARVSIRRKKSVYWKEMLATLSFAMNYPAKYFSAEDTLRLQKTLMPLISVVIAFVPQDSCEELFALHEAGRLQIISVDKASYAEMNTAEQIEYHRTDDNGKKLSDTYQTYIDCVGQPHLWIDDLPFPSLVKNKTVVQAMVRYRSNKIGETHAATDPVKTVKKDDNFFLKVPGIAINDSFQVIGGDHLPNPRLSMMAVPFIGGFNPDYSGLDFCEEAASKIVKTVLPAL